MNRCRLGIASNASRGILFRFHHQALLGPDEDRWEIVDGYRSHRRLLPRDTTDTGYHLRRPRSQTHADNSWEIQSVEQRSVL